VRTAAVLLLIGGCTTSPAPACADDPYAPYEKQTLLADLPNLTPGVYAEMGTLYEGLANAQTRTITVGLGYGDHLDYCPLLYPNFHATVDDTPVGEIFAGGVYCYSTGGPRCDPPTFTFTIPASDQSRNAVLTFSDSSLTVTVALGDVLVPRAITLVGASDWIFQSQQAVTVQWSTAADLATLPVTDAKFMTSARTYDLFDYVFRDGNRIGLRLPDATGPGVLGVSVSSSNESASNLLISQVAFHAAFLSAVPPPPIPGFLPARNAP
jgi:hypothetical protein